MTQAALSDRVSVQSALAPSCLQSGEAQNKIRATLRETVANLHKYLSRSMKEASQFTERYQMNLELRSAETGKRNSLVPPLNLDLIQQDLVSILFLCYSP